MSLEIRADNTSEILSKLSTAIERGLEKVGLEAEIDVERITPVDTGRLRNSIMHQVANGEKAVYVGTNVEYALFVHEGVHGRKGQPFLTNAVTRNAKKYREIIEHELKNA